MKKLVFGLIMIFCLAALPALWAAPSSPGHVPEGGDDGPGMGMPENPGGWNGTGNDTGIQPPPMEGGMPGINGNNSFNKSGWDFTGGDDGMEYQHGQGNASTNGTWAENQERNENHGGNQSMEQEMEQERIEARQNYVDQQSLKIRQEMQAAAGNATQNRVKLAVHALLGIENLTGIGKNVSMIAKEFNNSIKAVGDAEANISTRAGIMRTLFGGDYEAAGRLEMEAEQDQQRTRLLIQQEEACQDCDNQTRAFIREQISAMQNETARISALAQKEKSDTGILGWLFRN